MSQQVLAVRGSEAIYGEDDELLVAFPGDIGALDFDSRLRQLLRDPPRRSGSILDGDRHRPFLSGPVFGGLQRLLGARNVADEEPELAPTRGLGRTERRHIYARVSQSLRN